MGYLFHRITEDLIGRVHGPMALRLILQPTMAILFATTDGWRDARAARPPYVWSVLKDRCTGASCCGTG
jgi:hypothetical protein